MESYQKEAIILKLIQSLKAKGSWCGETHIQKSFYFLQELTGVPTEYSFILYKFGPFSFDFRDQLAVMRADYMLYIKPNSYPYGPSYHITDHILPRIDSMAPEIISQYTKEIAFVADNLNSKGVYELESLATALYAIKEKTEYDTDQKRAEYIHSIKLHVSIDEASDSLKTVHDLISGFQQA